MKLLFLCSLGFLPVLVLHLYLWLVPKKWDAEKFRITAHKEPDGCVYYWPEWSNGKKWHAFMVGYFDFAYPAYFQSHADAAAYLEKEKRRINEAKTQKLN